MGLEGPQAAYLQGCLWEGAILADPFLKCTSGLRGGEMETSQGCRTGKVSKIENANCRRRGAEGSIFAGLLPSRVDFRRGRKLCDKRGRSLHICRVVFKQG